MTKSKKIEEKCKVKKCTRNAVTLEHLLCWQHYKVFLSTGKVPNYKLRLYRPIPVFPELNKDIE